MEHSAHTSSKYFTGRLSIISIFQRSFFFESICQCDVMWWKWFKRRTKTQTFTFKIVLFIFLFNVARRSDNVCVCEPVHAACHSFCSVTSGMLKKSPFLFILWLTQLGLFCSTALCCRVVDGRPSVRPSHITANTRLFGLIMVLGLLSAVFCLQ